MCHPWHLSFSPTQEDAKLFESCAVGNINEMDQYTPHAHSTLIDFAAANVCMKLVDGQCAFPVT